MNYDSPAQIRAELAGRGLTLKKRWGQNFLVNRGARQSLIELLDPTKGDRVWEIGPGLGAMTELVLDRGARCVAFEIDRGLCRYLEETFGHRAGFSLVPGDFVKTWRQARKAHGDADLLLGNLPYRSASLMVSDIVEGGLRPRRCVLTVQREAAQRISSPPGTKAYSSFTVLCQAAFAVRTRGDLLPGSFYPVPEVTSTIIELSPWEDAPEGPVLEILQALARGLFAARRKTVRNNLSTVRLPAGVPTSWAAEELEKAGVEPGARAESLPPRLFVRVARALALRGTSQLRGPSGP